MRITNYVTSMATPVQFRAASQTVRQPIGVNGGAQMPITHEINISVRGAASVSQVAAQTQVR